MMIESDVLFAHLKESDWLKKSSDELLEVIEKGVFGSVHASRESLHELYYLSSKVGWKPDEALSKIGSLTQIKNLVWLPTTTDVDLLALSLLATYDLSSVFDAYHAAACLLGDPDHTMISTDVAYDKIKNLSRIEPQELLRKTEKKTA